MDERDRPRGDARPVAPTPAASAQETSGGSPLSLEVVGITKRYGDIVANDGVDFDLRKGEMHVLLGENGAGKTTLLNIIFGHVEANSGTIRVRGEDVQFSSPHDALVHGIGMVHQHFSLVTTFTVAENIALGVKPPWQRLRPAALRREIQAFLDGLGWRIDLDARIDRLPIETRQRVEIMKLLYRGVTTLLLDEPTSLLAPAMIDRLHETLADLKARSVSIVLVTHKLSEVMAIADRVTVLRAGKRVTVVERGELDERTLAVDMTGSDVRQVPLSGRTRPPREIVLEARNVVARDGQRHRTLGELSLTVRSGEILGIAGVEGNGQNELVDVLAGLRRPESGQVLVDGQDVTDWSPADLRAMGIAIVPSDRRGWGLVLDLNLAENLALSGVADGELTRYGFLRTRKLRSEAERLLAEFNVEPNDATLPCRALSGGNQQKLVLARELSKQPRILVAASPTWGLDFSAADSVHRRLIEARDRGCAIVLVSVDLDEVVKLSDRITVLYRGRALLERTRKDATREDIAMAMIGHTT